MSRYFKALSAERRLLTVSALIFIISGILGYANSEAIQSTLEETPFWSQLQQISEGIKKDPSFLHVFSTIFLNNLKAAVVMIGLGIFFCFFPIMALLSNGMILGVVLGNVSAETGVHPLKVFVTSILPHGILELPAIIIAAAFGIRLGINFGRWLFSWASPAIKERSRRDWILLFERIPTVMVGIVLLLFVAAIIESSLILFMMTKG
ncbi:stage II sporulation protein M [Kroppenstedtia pulmonis]|uniref:Stage II sporulation protein M n=1 Tax=Kroppenstedtia pulmonis TaxID=1380685 RepID=A0A7D3XT31_9BACL|nr:stage II sporulation protein M [Kroppenstedtia pulmonis]QKG85548.1 stage II sporulation protein M [Kroppenstedtia pulmonis]